MPTVQVDGNDVLAVERETRIALEHIRSGKGPYFIEAITYRFRPHSMFDAELYRSKDEVKEAKKRDPILLFTEYLKEKGMLSDADLEVIEADVARIVQHAVDFAEESPWEAPKTWNASSTRKGHDHEHRTRNEKNELPRSL